MNFGTEKFPDWNKVLEYFIVPGGGYFEKVQKKLLTVLEANKIKVEDIRLKCGSVVSEFIVTLKDSFLGKSTWWSIYGVCGLL